jgi:hypothetical protein
MTRGPGVDNHQVNFRDERGVVLNWLVKIGLVLAVIGVVIFDAGSIAVNFFGLDSAADDMAVILTTEIGSGGLPSNQSPQLVARAEELAADSNAKLIKVTYDGEILRITLRRRAKTIITGRIGPLKDWTRATAEGQSGTT